MNQLRGFAERRHEVDLSMPASQELADKLDNGEGPDSGLFTEGDSSIIPGTCTYVMLSV
jgi:hypothetical protein